MIKLWIVAFVLAALKFQENNVYAATVLLKSSQKCPNAPNSIPARLETTILKNFSNHTQLLKVTFDVPFPMDTNTVGNVKIEYNTFGNTWITVVNMDDKKGLCNFFNTAGGDLWSNFEKSAGMPLKACPIPQGKHHSDHYILDLTKQKIAGIPPGNYRIKLEVREKANNNRVVLCEMFNIEDKA